MIWNQNCGFVARAGVINDHYVVVSLLLGTFQKWPLLLTPLNIPFNGCYTQPDNTGRPTHPTAHTNTNTHTYPTHPHTHTPTQTTSHRTAPTPTQIGLILFLGIQTHNYSAKSYLPSATITKD